MLEVYDLQRRKTAILQNAFNKTEHEEINGVANFTFSLPADDKKNDYCRPFHYVCYNGGQWYRIVSPSASIESEGIITYQCEHVIATLIDDVVFGQHVVGNLGTYTEDCIRYVLSKQSVQRWVLAECDFRRQYEYAWENENLLAALFSIPNLFTAPYMWKYDTSVYPWRLSLKEIDESAAPEFYIRANKNLLSYEENKAAQEICTKLYCLGYGEGVNQLGIASVNNGSPFLLAPQAKIDEFGLITRIFVDRRFEDAASLLERGKAILAELQEPTSAKTFSVADLYELTRDDLDKAEIGRIARFTEDGTQTYITALNRNHDVVGDMQITLKTKAVDVAATIADLADRQRIEQVYSQGATQIYAQSVQANATTSVKAKLNFFIPAEMRIVNAVKLKISLAPFRSYSQATSGGGASVNTTNSGGGTNTTSSAGGGSQYTSSAGGGGTPTSSDGGSVNQSSGASSERTTSTTAKGGTYTGYSAIGGVSADTGSEGRTSGTPYYSQYDSHNHSYIRPPYNNAGGSYNYGWHRHYDANEFPHSHNMEHTHNISIGTHSHTVSIGSHSHVVNIGSHTHSITLYDHSHTVSIPEHTHGIVQGIFEFGNPSAAGLYINGVLKANIGNNAEVDITQYLLSDNGKIARGSWHKVEVLPNALAYVTIDMVVQGFIQSRGGNTV